MPQLEQKIPLTLLECIAAYARAGYGTFATTKDKKPAHGFGWKKAVVDTEPNAMQYPYGQFGVKLKADDLIIDLDPRNMKGREVWSELKTQVSTLGDLQTKATLVETGNGGLHIYLRKSPEFKIRKDLKEYPGIDFLSEGAYVIGAGSKVEGKGYSFLRKPFVELDAPDGLLNLIKKKVVDLGELNHKGFTDTPENVAFFISYLEGEAPIAIEGELGDKTTFMIGCRGRDFNLSMQKTYELMVKHYNPRCEPMWDARDLMQKVSNSYNYNEATPGSKDPQVVLPDLEGEDPEKWREKLSYKIRNGEKVGLKLTLNNAVLLVTHEIGVKGKFTYNAFNERLEIKGHVPWEKNRINRYNAIDDREIECIRLHLDQKFKIEFSSQTMWKAVDLVAAGNVFHPIKDVLDKYEWDGVERVDDWLQTYCGAADTELNHQMGRKVLCAMIARIYSPGCKFDYVLVLEGVQGIGKSTTCEILGGEWYGDAPINPQDKDCIPYIHSKWVVELSEMITTRKTEADRLKNFISRREDDIRLPYAKARQRFPRQCIFIGTINPDDVGYLTDTTGNRRFWPVFCNEFKLDDLKKDREQILAEAIVIYKAGESLMLPYDLVKESESEAMKRLADDPWQWMIHEWAASDDETEVSTQHIYSNVLGGNKQTMHTGHQRRIALALKNLGWVKGQSAKGLVYRKPEKEEADVQQK